MAARKSAAASEKRKRGRPTIFPDSLPRVAQLFPEVRSRRGQHELAYETLAMQMLGDEPGLGWIFGRRKMAAGAPNAWKRGILRALGRVHDRDSMIHLAHAVCEQKPRVRDAERVIRSLRRAGNRAPASAIETHCQA